MVKKTLREVERVQCGVKLRKSPEEEELGGPMQLSEEKRYAIEAGPGSVQEWAEERSPGDET